jgi:hypothetical protein
LNQLTETEKAYLAGFIDGEGCITILKQGIKGSTSLSYSLSVLISQADKSLLEDLADLLGMGKVHKTSSGIYNLFISRHDSAALLLEILPYLRLKKNQAVIGLEFFHNATGIRGVKADSALSTLREEYYLLMRSLKQNGLNETRGRKRKDLHDSK